MGNLVLGLDIGITSIGWTLYDQNKKDLVDMGVRIFDEAAQAKESRDHRSARRNLRHKKWRKRQLLHAFVDFGIINYDDVFYMDGKKECLKEEYLRYEGYDKEINTVYHLRNKALKEEVSTREMVIALYNICKTRGHFLLETVNYEKETITFDIFKEKFYSLVDSYVEFVNDKSGFESKILEPLFKKNSKLSANDIKKLIKNETFTQESDEALTEICLLIRNNKADLDKISPSVQLKENTSNKKLSIDELLRKDELNEFLEGCIELYDLINITAILQKYNYICEKDVELLDAVKEVYHKKDIEDPGFKDDKNTLQKKMTKVPSDKPDRIRAVKNIENKFPNGLYVKEAKAILKTQQKTNPKITDEFIEICCDIIKARIPYYIGPLGKDAKNGWADLKGQFKYSYNYSKDTAIDEAVSIEEWKKRMISHCTYLPDEYALPKGSFIAETFSIINELNNLNCTDKDENDYYLTADDKYKVFDELFLKDNKTFAYKDVASLLGLKNAGTKNKGTVQKFKNKYSLYFQIIGILPELKLNSITEIFSESEKIKKLEKVILDINLFDEEDSKLAHFKKEFDEETSKKLSKMKSKSFYAFSKKFICDTVINTEGKSLLEELFENNKAGYRNEQMTLITNATDINGNPINFSSNKYEEKFRNGEALGIDLLIDNGKPVIPISRSVVRALNECLKLYNSVIDLYGVPSRVVIETARDLKDSSQTGEIPAKHYNKMEQCYEDIFKQMKERKDEFKFQPKLESWDNIEKYLVKNKRKIELYIRQNGRDMISGEKIDIDNLQNYEMDHILPRGFGDNSMDNMMLIHKQYNTLKNNRVPLMYIREGAYSISANEPILESGFERRVTELFKLGLISENKVQRLLLKNTDEVEGFINKNLVDTRYIIREFMAILRAFNKENGYETHITALKSAYTDTYKKAFNIRKNRDLGVQHHALDAATLVLADQILSHFYPNYDQRGNFSAYQEMIRSMTNTEKNETAKLNRWINNMYKKTFQHDMNDVDSLLNTIKSTTPLYSQKAEKSYTGAYFDATIYPQDKYNDKNVLALLGINDDKKVFSSINSVAVDFYKYKDKKGNKKHVGIHIPKVIVDKDGNIDKEKYMILIKDYYKVPELIDENGNLKEYLFKIRVFKNDLIYDTKFNQIQKFNIGSIVNKKLEMKHIYDFAYNDIYGEFNDIRNSLIKAFNIRSYINKDKNAVNFSDVSNKAVVDFVLDNVMYVADRKRYEKTIRTLLKDVNNLDEFVEKMQYINLIVNRSCTPPTIIGQYMPVANNPGFDDDSQYVKIKCTPLGIRYCHNEKGTVLITGPRHHENAYSKIKKEQFSWRICKEVI